MKKLLLALLLLAPALIFAQGKAKTDTIAQGYYLPLDSNVVSCKVLVNGPVVVDKNLTGNKLSPDVIFWITRLPVGASVKYYEITVKQGGVLKKNPDVQYVIGQKSTRAAVMPPDREKISTGKLAALELDTNIISFVVSFMVDKTFVEYKAAGNKMPESAKASLSQLKPGSKVFVEQLLARGEDGSEVKLPGKVFIVE